MKEFSMESVSDRWTTVIGLLVCVAMIIWRSFAAIESMTSVPQRPYAGIFLQAGVGMLLGIVFLASYLSVRGKTIKVSDSEIRMYKGNILIYGRQLSDIRNLRLYRNKSGFPSRYEVEFSEGKSLGFASNIDNVEELIRAVKHGTAKEVSEK